MGGISPSLPHYSARKKSIRAGENLFARDSALLWISPVPFVRQDDARNLVTSEHQTMLWSSNLPLLGGQSATQFFLFGIARGGVRSGVARAVLRLCLECLSQAAFGGYSPHLNDPIDFDRAASSSY